MYPIINNDFCAIPWKCLARLRFKREIFVTFNLAQALNSILRKKGISVLLGLKGPLCSWLLCRNVEILRGYKITLSGLFSKKLKVPKKGFNEQEENPGESYKVGWVPFLFPCNWIKGRPQTRFPPLLIFLGKERVVLKNKVWVFFFRPKKGWAARQELRVQKEEEEKAIIGEEKRPTHISTRRERTRGEKRQFFLKQETLIWNQDFKSLLSTKSKKKEHWGKTPLNFRKKYL